MSHQVLIATEILFSFKFDSLGTQCSIYISGLTAASHCTDFKRSFRIHFSCNAETWSLYLMNSVNHNTYTHYLYHTITKNNFYSTPLYVKEMLFCKDRLSTQTGFLIYKVKIDIYDRQQQKQTLYLNWCTDCLNYVCGPYKTLTVW